MIYLQSGVDSAKRYPVAGEVLGRCRSGGHHDAISIGWRGCDELRRFLRTPDWGRPSAGLDGRGRRLGGLDEILASTTRSREDQQSR
jgi:hypothetical protein